MLRLHWRLTLWLQSGRIQRYLDHVHVQRTYGLVHNGPDEEGLADLDLGAWGLDWNFGVL